MFVFQASAIHLDRLLIPHSDHHRFAELPDFLPEIKFLSMQLRSVCFLYHVITSLCLYEMDNNHNIISRKVGELISHLLLSIAKMSG